MSGLWEKARSSRSGELFLLALKEPSTLEKVAGETGMYLFRVRSGVRQLLKAGFLDKSEELYATTPEGFEKLEGEA